MSKGFGTTRTGIANRSAKSGAVTTRLTVTST
jgi:hypothetical protein